MNIEQWAEQVFGSVEQDGAAVARVRLVTTHDGQCWNTWVVSPGKDAHDWATDVQSYLRTLQNEWPSRRVQVAFLAETAMGETLSTLPQTVEGKAAKGALDTHQAAAAVAFDNIANTIEKLQRLVNTQLDAARRTAESNADMIHQQTQLISLYREQEIAGTDADKSAMVKLLEENAGDILKLAEAYLTPKAPSNNIRAIKGKKNG